VAPGRTWGFPSRSASSASSCTRATAPSCTPAFPASCGVTASSAAYIALPTPARRGAASSRARTLRPAAPDSPWTRRTRTCSSPGCGISGERVGPSDREARAEGPERQRPLSHRRRGTHVVRSSGRAERSASEALGEGRGGRRAVGREADLRARRVGGFRALRLGDGGKTWEARDKSQMMVWRPFYFARLVVDPTNPNRVFKGGRRPDRQRRRGTQLRRHERRRPRRLARRLDRSPTTRSTSSPATTAVSGSPMTAGAGGGRRTTCRSRSSTT
jgi:hypothetical protein